MKGAIMQPTYLPWIGYFAMIESVDIFVFLDDVQLTKRSWQVRNKIKERDGKELMLSIPVHTEGRDNTRICDAAFAEKGWKNKHLTSIRQIYSKARYYKEVMSLIDKRFYAEHEKLSDFHIDMISSVCNYLGITTPMIRSSELDGIQGTKDDLLVSICKKMGITSYLSAKGSSVYIESSNKGGAFAREGIVLEYQNYEHPVYNQLGEEFMPYMGIIDILFNEGKNALTIIKSGIRDSFNSDNVFEDNYEQ